MKAYGIFDGGGVKGAALAGCLKAAEEVGIDFVGYGGTSAGSIVALLACVGYSADEVKYLMVDETDFSDFLDDGGAALVELKTLAENCSGLTSTAWSLLRHGILVRRLRKHLGLYEGTKLTEFLLKAICRRKQEFQGARDITFDDLSKAGCKPLKIMASDVRLRKPVVYSGNGGTDLNGSVLDAVRASMSYPFVFRPVKVNQGYLVDGGLSSNLPIFLFETERAVNRVPVIAFDLASSPGTDQKAYSLRHFCDDMLATALESGDQLIGTLLRGVFHVVVRVPQGVDTLDFHISKQSRLQLFDTGLAHSHSYFRKVVPHWAQANTAISALQALHAEPRIVAPVIEAFCRNIERLTKVESVRASVMLPTDRNTRVVAYQYGMDNDPDVDLELSMDGGCSGRAWVEKSAMFADLEKTKTNFDTTWRMSREQQNKIPKDRKAILSVPIFDNRDRTKKVDERRLVGILSADTITSLAESNWLPKNGERSAAVEIALSWAEILGMILN